MTVAPKTFSGKRLRLMRERAKMSQQDLADKMCVDRRYISLWETGKHDPSIPNLWKIVSALRCGLEDLCE